MSLSIVVLVATPESVFGDVTDSLDVHDSLHHRAASGDGHQIISFGYSGTLTSSTSESSSATAAASSTTTAPGRRTGRRLGRTQIDLTGLLAESAALTAPAASGSTPALRHPLAKGAHSRRVAARAHRTH